MDGRGVFGKDIDAPKRFENINLKGNAMESTENTRNVYEKFLYAKFLKFKIANLCVRYFIALSIPEYTGVCTRQRLIYLVPQNRTKTKENGSFYKFLLGVTLFLCKFIYYFCQL